MADQVSEQLDYKVKVLSKPNYKYSQLLPQSNATVNISSSGGNDTVFILPRAVCSNLARSVLRFTATPTATPIAGANNLVNWAFMDVMGEFQQIQFQSRKGIDACNYTQCQNFSKVAFKANVKRNEFLNYDKYFDGVGTGRILRPSNGVIGETVKGIYTMRPNNTDASVAYTENSYLEMGTISTNAAVGPGPVLDYEIPLGMLFDTIFELDKDIMFSEDMLIRFVWGPSAKFGFCSRSVSDPTATPTVLQGSVAISNLKIYLATERNQAIVNEIQAKIDSPQGFSIPIPYITSYINTSAPSTTQQATVNISSAQGRNLLKIYHAIFPAAETLNLTYNNSVTTTKLVDFYTMLNANERLQDFTIRTAVNDDWVMMQKKLEGSLINDLNTYRYNWFWLEDFSSLKSVGDAEDNDNLISGLPLDKGIRYDFVATTDATAYNHYDFVVCQKILNIVKDEVRVL